MNIFKYIILPLVFIFLALILLTSYFSGGVNTLFNQDSQRVAELGVKAAPLFNIPSIESGKMYKLDDYGDKIVILLFFASWSNESIDQLAIFSNFMQNYKFLNEVQIIAVNSGEDSKTVKTVINRGGYAVPVALDETQVVADKYSINNLPTIVYIDRNGNIRKIVNSMQSAKDIGDNIENLIAN